jgi:hypothetical protein
MTKHYARPVTHERNQLARITEACEAAGIKPPTRALELKATIEAGGQDVNQTAAALALEALTNDVDPAKWYGEALDAIRDAQARQTLAQAFGSVYSQSVARALPTWLSAAAAELAPYAAKAAKALTDAAKHLPAGDAALDAEANLEADTGQHLTAARAALAKLATLAGIYPQPTPGNALPEWVALLPVVGITSDVAVEKVEANLAANTVVRNPEALATTYAIRDAAREARERGADLALVNIARGSRHGLTIAFATPEQHLDRRRLTEQAYKRETVRTIQPTSTIAF